MKKMHKHYKGIRNRIQRIYYVSYQWNTITNHGFGSVELTIKGNVDPGEMKEYIEKKYSLDNVIIVSWQPIKGGTP